MSLVVQTISHAPFFLTLTVYFIGGPFRLVAFVNLIIATTTATTTIKHASTQYAQIIHCRLNYFPAYMRKTAIFRACINMHPLQKATTRRKPRRCAILTALSVDITYIIGSCRAYGMHSHFYQYVKLPICFPAC